MENEGDEVNPLRRRNVLWDETVKTTVREQDIYVKLRDEVVGIDVRVPRIQIARYPLALARQNAPGLGRGGVCRKDIRRARDTVWITA